jgi:hypothetical protein
LSPYPSGFRVTTLIKDRVRNLNSPERMYKLPEKVYKLPERVYKLPESGYKLPERVYKPPESGYKPPDVIKLAKSGHCRFEVT